MRIVEASFKADAGTMPCILDLAESVSSANGLDSDGLLRMRLNLEEVLLGLAEYGDRLGAAPDATLEVSREGDDLVFAVRDKGMPFDYVTMEDEGHSDIARILRRSDGVQLRNLGRGGREQSFRIRAPAEAVGRAEEDAPPRAYTPDDFDIHPMRPEERVQVPRCLYDEFGYSYINEAVYIPDRLQMSAEEGSVIPFTSTSPEGEVAGFMSLLRDTELPGTAEMAMVVVKKRFRKLSIMNRLIDNSIRAAESMGMASVNMEPVAYHPFTQMVSDRKGMTPCGIWLNKIPADLDTSYGEERRRSLFWSALLFSDSPRRIHIPSETEGLCRRIISGLGAERVLADPSEPAGATSADISHNDVMGTSRIHVRAVGTDAADVLRRRLHESKRLGCELTELAIDLRDPAAPYAYEAARDLGFFCAGMFPACSDRDLLLMQNTMSRAVDYETIQTTDGFGELLKAVRGFDPEGDL